jgi:hypothetical protein
MVAVQMLALGRGREELFAIPSGEEHIVPSNMRSVVTGLEGLVIVPRSYSWGPSRRLWALPDGNRAAILLDPKIEMWQRSLLVGIKGVGARSPMFDDGMPETTEPVFFSESWFGESPWGAMGRTACLEDRDITELSGPGGINGFHICPMVRASSLPPRIMEAARESFWYRRFGGEGPFFQQVRLLPSDVRLFYQAESTLGWRTAGVLDSFRVQTTEALDAFINNYIRSGLAALTLVPRSLGGGRALEYQDVWLDKDSVIAPDGTLFFVDIEGLSWAPFPDGERVAEGTRKQFERNFYEFMYGLDRLLRERETMSGRPSARGIRRQEAAGRFELAMDGDRFAAVERNGRSVDLIAGGTSLRLFDLAEGTG